MKNIPATVAPGFHLLEEGPLLFLVRPRRRKIRRENEAQNNPNICMICKKEHDLQPVNKYTQDLCLSKDCLYNSQFLFLPLFSLTVISSVAYKFQHKLFSPYMLFLHSKTERFSNYSDIVLGLPSHEAKCCEGSGQWQVGSWIYSEWIRFSSKH